MNELNIDLENCYGIKKLQYKLDFSKKKAYAIYAPNGAMKTSLAQTFKDIADAVPSKDRIFPNRVCKRQIKDDNGVDLAKETVLVVRPYEDGDISHTEKTSTLLVDSRLRKEYGDLHRDIEKSKEIFLKAMKEQSGSKKDLEKEIASAFTRSDDFRLALMRVRDEMMAQKDAPFADISYDTVFDEKVLEMLGTKDVKTAIENYIKKYNELLANSIYFKKGIFNYYNATTIAKSLADNGFFNAKHTVNLNAAEKLEITSRKQLEELIQKEKDGISKDKDLKKKFADIEKLIQRNVTVRFFEAYLGDHEEILPELINIENFKERIWKSYFKARFDIYNDLVEKYQAAEKRRTQIEDEAKKQSTQWETVIEIFNSRFFVPFKLEAKNRIPVMLGQEQMLTLGFTFEEGTDHAAVERDALMKVLSTGERRAFYILNIIFEVEARKKLKQETLLVIDDIADSFDYRNKYAIIQYLKDIAEEPYFNQIILTHNFDFFRTINSRFIDYPHCLMAVRSSDHISLDQAKGIQNVFGNDWRMCFFTDPKKKIASIPFVRNLIEYTKGKENPEYVKLTSLLHWKSDSDSITEKELDTIYGSVCCTTGATQHNGTGLVVDTIQREAEGCLKAGSGINLENKIVLSMPIRPDTDYFMVVKINDAKFVDSIDKNQTPRLLTKFKELFPTDVDTIKIIERVVLMTPENIHLNSFMYEPILDMSDEHLRKLYQDIRNLV
jgi:hypothetical protein